MAETANAAGLFEQVWNTLVSVLGTAATATLFRRAARNAGTKHPRLEELHGLDFVREGMEHRVVLPPSWERGSEGSYEALRVLVAEELCPLLFELTGPVVVRLLENQPEIQRCGMLAGREEST